MVSEDGRAVLVKLSVEDILPDIVEGHSPVELMIKYNAPVKAMEHLIASIPEFMAWRDAVLFPQVDFQADIQSFIDDLRSRQLNPAEELMGEEDGEAKE
jgi:hypothetical protein